MRDLAHLLLKEKNITRLPIRPTWVAGRFPRKATCFVQAHLQDYWLSQDSHFARGTRGHHLRFRTVATVGEGLRTGRCPRDRRLQRQRLTVHGREKPRTGQ